MSFNPNAKISGPYVNSVLAHLEARKAGYDEALLLTQQGFVAEGSGENIFIVRNGVLCTPPLGNILPGITRNAVIQIAKDLKIRAREKKFHLKDCYKADECFLTGTAAEVTPVGKIDKKIINNGNIGPVTLRVKTYFEEIVKGERKAYKKWLTYVQ